MNTHQRPLVLCPNMSLNASNISTFRRSLHEAIHTERNENILLDLRQVDLIDSAAVVTLIQSTKLANANGKRLGLCGLNSQVKMVLELTQMDRFVRIFANEAEFMGETMQLMAA